MKDKKVLCDEFCNFYCQNFVFFSLQLRNLINYSFCMYDNKLHQVEDLL